LRPENGELTKLTPAPRRRETKPAVLGCVAHGCAAEERVLLELPQALRNREEEPKRLALVFMELKKGLLFPALVTRLCTAANLLTLVLSQCRQDYHLKLVQIHSVRYHVHDNQTYDACCQQYSTQRTQCDRSMQMTMHVKP